MSPALRPCLGALAYLVGLGLAPAFAAFDEGPWVQSSDHSTVEILIEGDDGDDTGTVEYGTSPAYGSLEPMAKYFGPASRGEIFRARLTGLDADTRYFYRVTHEGISKTGSFFTAAPPGQTFTFVVTGDTRSNHTGHTNVAQGIVEYFAGAHPDLFFNTGDLVASGEDEDDWDTFFQIEVGAGLLNNTIFHAAFGNHEEGSFPDPTLFYRYFSAHDAGDNKGWYSFDYGNAHFSIVNTEAGCSVNTEQGVWLDQDLAAANANPETPFKFVYFHKPGVTTGSSHGPEFCVTGSNGIIDLFEEHNVDVVWDGHNHHYEHTLLNGVRHVTQGAGGVGLGGFDRTSSHTVFKKQMFGFVVVTVSPDGYTAETYEVDQVAGGLIGMVDQFSGSPGDGGVPGPTPSEFQPGADGCTVGTSPSSGNPGVIVLLLLPGWLMRRRAGRRARPGLSPWASPDP